MIEPRTVVKVYGHQLGNRSRHRQSKGAPAIVVKVVGARALIRPFGHGKDEWVRVEDCRVWKSRNVQGTAQIPD